MGNRSVTAKSSGLHACCTLSLSFRGTFIQINKSHLILKLIQLPLYIVQNIKLNIPKLHRRVGLYRVCIWTVLCLYLNCIVSVSEPYRVCIWTVSCLYLNRIVSVSEPYRVCIWTVSCLYLNRMVSRRCILYKLKNIADHELQAEAHPRGVGVGAVRLQPPHFGIKKKQIL